MKRKNVFCILACTAVFTFAGTLAKSFAADAQPAAAEKVVVAPAAVAAQSKSALSVHAYEYIPEKAPVIVSFHLNSFFAHDVYENIQQYVKDNVDPLVTRVVTEGKLTEEDLRNFEFVAFQPNYSTELTKERVKVDGEGVFAMPNMIRYFKLFSKYASEYKLEVIDKDGNRGFRKDFEYVDQKTGIKTVTHILFEFIGNDLLVVRTTTNREAPEWQQWQKGAENPMLKRIKPASDIIAVAFDMTAMPKEHTGKNETLSDVSQNLDKAYFRFYQSSSDKYMVALILSCFDNKSCKALKLLADAFLLLIESPEEENANAEATLDEDFAMKKFTTIQFLRALRYGSRGNDLIFQLKISDELLKNEMIKFREKQAEQRKKAIEKKAKEVAEQAKNAQDAKPETESAAKK